VEAAGYREGPVGDEDATDRKKAMKRAAFAQDTAYEFKGGFPTPETIQKGL
jgi:hypothetical protein